jgi:hypothetical protein
MTLIRACYIFMKLYIKNRILIDDDMEFFSAKDDISVPLDCKTAWMLYQCVKKGIILTRSQQRREQQQLIKGLYSVYF